MLHLSELDVVSSIQILYLCNHKQLIICIVLMVSMLYDVLELKKVLLDGQNFFVFEEFLYLCGCATPMGSGGKGCACCPQVTLRQAQGSRCGYYFVRPRWGRSGHSMPFLTRFARSDAQTVFFALAQDFCYARHNSSKLDFCSRL